MDDTFQNMIESIFDNDIFTEYVYINGFKETCVCSSLGNGIVYTEAGLQNDCNFTLDLIISKLHQFPKIGDKVMFREKSYKIGSYQIDSAGVCIKLSLISTSKGA